ncbi:hypothetical protein [Burkholderia pseudomultivorans]|uniref:5-formyltetrahydrofolate cyclo-ligase n=2 Tax=Burkholderia pseudomultivorans TaxID=1207504 RepID=A0A6P2QY01_9BURK|nr:hypothetical protein [Burkholderia pseudomultivorans]MDR8730673.1 hypothetical protein [Burkholderia pseudomultivorans]MDR8734265.1 hypothetical protein [Burkholderia pseudomultivorans]MDR8744470.1 hypothetical protein [Burkholderia pseudomultivorans]MDR8753248.1 hypothetical protein [Burkholderia pseudomultivorans]MDR8778822.1 hypothetical protein [Burkholderia pseudomultivorans]
MKRRTLLRASAIAITAGLAGCTSMLFEDGRYDETVDRFLVSEDGKKFVVLGQQYHYIFDMPEHFGAMLVSPYRQSLEVSLVNFVARGGAITGDYWLRLRPAKPLTADERAQALADGFTTRGSVELEMKGTLHGTRYRADGFDQGKTWSSFSRPYTIDVVDRLTTADKAVRVLATPVTLAADGVLMVGAVALSPVIIVALLPAAGLAIGP